MFRSFVISVMALAAAACGPAQTAQPVAAEPVKVPEAEAPLRPDPHNLIGNIDFETQVSHPWMAVILKPAEAKARVEDGAFCVDIEKPGDHPWDIQLSHRGLHIEKGHTYRLKASIRASAVTDVRVKIGMSGPPYTEYLARQATVNTEPEWFEGEVVMSADSDPSAELAFHVGGKLAAADDLPLTVCIDDITLTNPEFTRPSDAAERPQPHILVNQVGYLPKFKKTAVLRSNSQCPVKWALHLNDAPVASGETTVFGDDVASGEHLHLIDFTSVHTPAKGYILRAGEAQSHPFAIAPNLYSKMKYDALAYFYHNRSGVPIEMPYAGGEQWTRPAGHESDESVPCLPDSGCDYKLDVKGGWYDAGDHGKYVVNAGYSVWAMLNQYERSVHLGKSEEAFKDGTLNIPESKNGVPDLLDEARFEIEFMLKMRVPRKEPLAGMVHHKMHDEDWSGIPTAPDKDPMKRYLNPPSTAATLNLAAVAAQAARIWKTIDPKFAKTCLKAAKKSYSAARANPDIYAPNNHKGGGPYEDKYVKDEFYWAATELFITTGKYKFLRALERSPHHITLPTVDKVDDREIAKTAMSWQSVDGLATISLVVVPNRLPKKVVVRLREKITEAAEASAEVITKEGYRMPLSSQPEVDYYWGSNFAIMNNLIILALAYDFTQDATYIDALTEGMDYLLGQNPMDQCYVTGYGARPLENPHHRFWAHQADPRFPPPPPGAISGGPNQHMQDPRVIAAAPGKCAPATCFIDHIDSYSTNEVAINWNAALAWLAAYLDEVANNNLND